MSMDVNGGKIIWAKHSEIQQANLKALPEGIILELKLKLVERLSEKYIYNFLFKELR